MAARRTERLQELTHSIQKEYPSVQVHPLTLDVRNRQGVFDAVASLPAAFKNIQVLVNNAGLVIGLDHLDKVTEEAFDTMMDTNVKGLVNVTQAILPGMKDRKEGHIINISSIAGTGEFY